jgi:hypothetical protein
MALPHQRQHDAERFRAQPAGFAGTRRLPQLSGGREITEREHGTRDDKKIAVTILIMSRKIHRYRHKTSLATLVVKRK